VTQLAAVGAALVAIAAFVAVFIAANVVVDHLPRRLGGHVRPWLFLGLALLLTAVGLVWPALRTIYLSFHAGRSGDGPFTLDQWSTVLGDNGNFNADRLGQLLVNPLFLTGVCLAAMVGVAGLIARVRGRKEAIDRGSPIVVTIVGVSAFLAAYGVFTTLRGVIPVTLWWMVTVPTVATIGGLIIAVLANGRRGESFAKSVLFMPMAVSLVGAGIIWRFMYYANTPREDIGLINAILNGIGIESVDFYNGANMIPWNNLVLMVIVIWIYTGFSVIVFSAAVKSVPDELVEAAKIDGANGFQTTWYIVLPLIRGTLIVVATTITIFVTKIFDVIKATTDGSSGTEVLGLAVFRYLSYSDFARSAVFAVIILALVGPLMVYSLRYQMRAET
jgi:alpha-glucoside transport system permease protein